MNDRVDTASLDDASPTRADERAPVRDVSAEIARAKGAPAEATGAGAPEAGAQDRLAAEAERGGAGRPPADPDPTPERAAAIDAFLAEKANAKDRWTSWGDADGGTLVGEALRGRSDLGGLTQGERDHLADGAVAAWQAGGHDTGRIDAAAAAVRGDERAATALAGALARPAGAEARHHAAGGTSLASPEHGAFRAHATEVATRLDPLAAIGAFRGAEAELVSGAVHRDREAGAITRPRARRRCWAPSRTGGSRGPRPTP